MHTYIYTYNYMVIESDAVELLSWAVAACMVLLYVNISYLLLFYYGLDSIAIASCCTIYV